MEHQSRRVPRSLLADKHNVGRLLRHHRGQKTWRELARVADDHLRKPCLNCAVMGRKCHMRYSSTKLTSRHLRNCCLGNSASCHISSSLSEAVRNTSFVHVDEQDLAARWRPTLQVVQPRKMRADLCRVWACRHLYTREYALHLLQCLRANETLRGDVNICRLTCIMSTAVAYMAAETDNSLR